MTASRSSHRGSPLGTTSGKRPSPPPAPGIPGLRGVYNFRDLADVAGPNRSVLRSGHVYRADGLHRAPQSDRPILRQLGIRRVIDLRTSSERAKEGWFESPGVAVDHIPIVDQMADLAGSMAAPTEGPAGPLLGHYLEMTRRNGEAFTIVLSAIASSLELDEPVVFHCTAGKDRTGVLAALILGGLGVDQNHIAYDYSRSADAMPHMMAWYRETSDVRPEERMREMGLDPSMADEMMAARPGVMLAFLETLRAGTGGVRRYLADIDAVDAVHRIARVLITSP